MIPLNGPGIFHPSVPKFPGIFPQTRIFQRFIPLPMLVFYIPPCRKTFLEFSVDSPREKMGSNSRPWEYCSWPVPLDRGNFVRNNTKYKIFFFIHSISNCKSSTPYIGLKKT